jgi:hypothetical protein
MNDAFSLSISVGIIAFGIWIAAGAIGAGSTVIDDPGYRMSPLFE